VYRIKVTEYILSQSQSTILDKGNSAGFKNIVRNILTLGSGLTHSKDVRDIFSILMEKIVEPCSSLSWSVADMELVFSGLSPAFNDLSSISPNLRKRYQSSFARLASGVKLAAVRLYQTTISAGVVVNSSGGLGLLTGR